jgi:flagellar biosynthesis protein FliP
MINMTSAHVRRSMKSQLWLLSLVCLMGAEAVAQDKVLPFPKIAVEVGKATKPEDVSVTLQILFLMTILSLAPAILILTTAFTRIIIVLHFLRQAIGTPQMPPAQVMIGLAMFLTFFIMAPVWSRVNDEALQPYLNEKMALQEAYDKGVVPLREFMFKQTREEDLALFVKLADHEKPKTRADVPTHALIPAFALSELRTGFQIGFVLFIPFIIIDMVIASVLMSMGMMMLPPMMISLPFKLLLFILVDGWHLIVGSIINSFH